MALRCEFPRDRILACRVAGFGPILEEIAEKREDLGARFRATSFSRVRDRAADGLYTGGMEVYLTEDQQAFVLQAIQTGRHTPRRRCCARTAGTVGVEGTPSRRDPWGRR